MNKIRKVFISLFLFAGLLSSFFVLPQDVYAAEAGADLVVADVDLYDKGGNLRKQFYTDEEIFVRFIIKNQGNQTASNRYAPSGNIWTQVYGNKPQVVPFDTESDVRMWIRNENNIGAQQDKTYKSWPGGLRENAFEGNRSWKKSSPGAYTARVFVNYDKLAKEINYTNNQRVVSYTIVNRSQVQPTAKPTLAPTSTPTPTPVKPSPTPQVPVDAVSAVCKDAKITISFNKAPEGTVKWAIRVDDRTDDFRAVNPHAGDTLIEDFTGTTFTRNASYGRAYGWWVHPLNASGMGWETVYSGDVYCNIDKPSGLKSRYEAPNMIISWNKVPGAKYYLLRVDNQQNGWNPDALNKGDYRNDHFEGTSFSFPVAKNQAVAWWIHAVDESGKMTADIGDFFVVPQQ